MFCPHSVFMCFVWIWEQTAIISRYNINWLVLDILYKIKKKALPEDKVCLAVCNLVSASKPPAEFSRNSV